MRISFTNETGLSDVIPGLTRELSLSSLLCVLLITFRKRYPDNDRGTTSERMPRVIKFFLMVRPVVYYFIMRLYYDKSKS